MDRPPERTRAYTLYPHYVGAAGKERRTIFRDNGRAPRRSARGPREDRPPIAGNKRGTLKKELPIFGKMTADLRKNRLTSVGGHAILQANKNVLTIFTYLN